MTEKEGIEKKEQGKDLAQDTGVRCEPLEGCEERGNVV